MAGLAQYSITDSDEIQAIEPALRKAIGALLLSRDWLADIVVTADREWWSSAPPVPETDSDTPREDYPRGDWPEPDWLIDAREGLAEINSFLSDAEESGRSTLTKVTWDPETGYDWQGLFDRIQKSDSPDDTLGAVLGLVAEFVVTGVVIKYGPRALKHTKSIALKSKRHVAAAIAHFGVKRTAKYAVLGPAAATAAVVASKKIATPASKAGLKKILLWLGAIAAIGLGGKKIGEGAKSIGKGALWLGVGALALILASRKL